jgi:hypothetical protein
MRTSDARSVNRFYVYYLLWSDSQKIANLKRLYSDGKDVNLEVREQ